MKKSIPYIFLAVLLSACYVTRVVEPPREVHMRSIHHRKDSGLRFNTRYVFSRIPCDSVSLLDKRGNTLPMWTENTDTNKAYYYCGEFDRNNALMVLDLKYNNQTIFMDIRTDGSINLSTSGCSKYLDKVTAKWGDSIPVVMWTEVHKETGSLHIYLAEESYSYPYYKDTTLDSLVFKFSEICTEKKREEEKKSTQDFYDKYMKVQVTPNPFTEKFDLILTAGTLPMFMISKTPLLIGFFDDQGNPLLSQTIELDKTYTFSFPDILPGKTIYYRITWEDYVIAGQVLKN